MNEPLIESTMRKALTYAIVLSAGSFLLLNRAQAQPALGVVLGIDDSTEGVVTAVGIPPFGFDPASLNIQAFQEEFDLHGEYLSSLPPAFGQSITVNFHFLEAPGGLLSDTLNIVLTGHEPTAQDPNNVSVDLHFRSDVDGQDLPPLVNPIAITEVAGFIPLDLFIIQAGGPSDFHLSVQSDVDVPDAGPTMGLLLASSALLLGVARRNTA